MPPVPPSVALEAALLAPPADRALPEVALVDVPPTLALLRLLAPPTPLLTPETPSELSEPTPGEPLTLPPVVPSVLLFTANPCVPELAELPVALVPLLALSGPASAVTAAPLVAVELTSPLDPGTGAPASLAHESSPRDRQAPARKAMPRRLPEHQTRIERIPDLAGDEVETDTVCSLAPKSGYDKLAGAPVPDLG